MKHLYAIVLAVLAVQQTHASPERNGKCPEGSSRVMSCVEMNSPVRFDGIVICRAGENSQGLTFSRTTGAVTSASQATQVSTDANGVISADFGGNDVLKFDVKVKAGANATFQGGHYHCNR